MRVLVFGENGQVATSLRKRAGDIDVICLGRDQADLGAPDMLRAAIEATDADVIINAAAYTAVDKAETDSDQAEQVNHLAVGTMARAAAKRGIPFLHISTDYVFPGDGDQPWQPDDETGALGVYGATKRRGEEAIEMAGGVYAVLRTSWVVSSTGNNFVKTMLRLGADRDVLTIIDDQTGGPTAADDIADALLTMARAYADGRKDSGIYHFSGAPDCTWAGFAAEIFDQAGITCEITPIPTTDYPTPAARPLNSRLDCSTLETDFGIKRPDWRKSLVTIVKDLT
ncbi:dTDP-4-dehydrorhamnose reductase [Loktanella ponticola]|uniref:dTDP-4-dehydrorhamnose reductase n=1 Tax=Yoonia ponticola TaxID=1524255 RepID=A0A7W9EZB1_9RHOB|nr:dTDP-4-dehydrorhamnose reductase [Yoonia ponticola]MBB5723622.1 dTDP-4-dehydrorhamnose reductase [Yoonia ponticola]